MTTPDTPQVDEILETLMAAKVDGSGNEQDKAIAKAAINLLRIEDLSKIKMLAERRGELKGRINEHWKISHDILSNVDLRNLETATVGRLMARNMELESELKALEEKQ